MATTSSPGNPPRNAPPPGAAGMVPIWVGAAFAALLLGGGLITLLAVDVGDRNTVKVAAAAGLEGVLLVALAFGARGLKARLGRTFAISATGITLMALLGLIFLEVAARLAIPAFPARALHAVKADVAREAWGRVTSLPGAVGFNSWGQRDHERTLEPVADTERWAFVGDSFLEDSTSTPVSVATEAARNAGGKARVEILNLGVSSTSPDEYFYRTRRVALPLGARRVVMFIFAGNDLIQQRTVRSFHGIASPFPRDSFLHHAGLAGLNFVLTHHRRPIVEAWGKAGELGKIEIDLQARVHAMKTQEEWHTYLRERASGRNESERAALEAHLARVDTTPVMRIMQEPDGGLFRSYYIGYAEQALLEPVPTHTEDATYTSGWVLEAARACAERGVAFDVVLVPEGASVDDRMHEQWLPIGDLRPFMAPRVRGMQQLKGLLTAAGIRVVDLYPVLQGTRGTYLNVDGHWSADGVQRVAAHLASTL